MIDYSHPARHAHHVKHHGFRHGWLNLSATDTGTVWTIVRDGRIHTFPVKPSGRAAHRPAPVSLVKSYV